MPVTGPGGASPAGRPPQTPPGGASPAGRPPQTPPARRWYAELALLPAGIEPGVLIEASGQRFAAVTPGVSPACLPPGTARLPGVTLPGLANAHSHAFHRALRGVTQAGPGTFWTWRERMYEVAARLQPDSYLALARAVYAEMALAGITCVGEFHYLHHDHHGARYADPNEMGRALLAAAAAAGLRITLLDACYLAGGLAADGSAQPLAGTQLRFGDGDGQRWAERADALGADPHGMLADHARGGVAIHSVRAVPPGAMPPVVAWSHSRGAPLHAHLSEQPAENQACLAAYGVTPAGLLGGAGALGPRTTVVHATHVTAGDIALLGQAGAAACLCPTTEADLGDGLGPAGDLAAAGCPISLGSDSQAVIDLLTEARQLELGERLRTGRRGCFLAAELARAATMAGHACLGWPDAGEIVPGALADLVTVSLDSPRLAGTPGGSLPGGSLPGAAPAAAGATGPVLASVLFAGTAADVRNVVIGGRDVVADGRHLLVADVPAALAAAIRPLLSA